MLIAFLIISLIVTLVYLHFTSLVIWKGILLFAGCFLALNLLFVLFWAIISVFVPTGKPITKQSGICRLGCISVSSLACGYALVRYHLSGTEKLPKDSRFLFVCNHRSGFDPLVTMSILKDYNISFISKPSNMRIPVLGRISYGAGFLPIDRENSRNALGTILTACRYLENGLCSIGIYPEGTRSKTKELLPFHAGSFKIAQRAHVPLVIASIRGSERALKNLFIRPTDVYLDIIEVLDAETVASMSSNQLAEHSRKLISENLKLA